jgi:hypothetical protein
MPSPHSRIAPYFSGHVGTFDAFLEEFKARAYDCRLTDLQQVNTLVRYVNPSFCEMCKSLNGYWSCNWILFQHSLINTFSTITPHHQIMKQKLSNFVKDSSRMHMDRKEDVLQYYQMFKHYSNPLVCSGHLTETNRDIKFGTAFTLKIVMSFGHISSLCSPSIGTAFPSILKMFSIAHADHLPTRNTFCSGCEIKSLSIQALVAGTPCTPTHQTLHSPHFHACFQSLSTSLHPR